MSKIANNKKKKKKSNKTLKLEEENKILEAEIKELKSKNIALLAEFDNYKKRVYNQMSNDKKYEGKDIFVNIIPIIDDIERVLIVEDVDSKSIISGIDLIKNKFLSVLEDLGVNSYKSIGKLFNPDYHEAIMMKKTKKKSNIIIEEYERGYTQHDKVLRHAKVIVSE